ncbi:MAG: endopeptidase La, partial [Massilimaliae sp.]|nr:endopeptidase La [Massiliimalia sp.]
MKRFEIENTVIVPALAMRGLVMMEKMSLHFDVGRKKSILALQQAMANDKKIFLVAQKDVMTEDPKPEDLYKVGVVAVIKQMLKGQEGVVHVMVEGLCRAKIVEYLEQNPSLVVELQECTVSKRRAVTVEEMEALMRVVKSLFESYSLLVPKMSKDIILEALSQDTPEGLFEAIAYNIMIPFEDRQELLEANSYYKRLKLLTEILQRESEVLSLERDIYEQVKEQMDKNQRDYFLREQMRVIAGELGEGEDVK